MTLQRSFTIREKLKFVFGIQAYNVLNHANFANPSGTLTSGAFGTITSTLGPPTSIYGTGQGASVSGRLAVLTGTFIVLSWQIENREPPVALRSASGGSFSGSKQEFQSLILLVNFVPVHAVTGPLKDSFELVGIPSGSSRSRFNLDVLKV